MESTESTDECKWWGGTNDVESQHRSMWLGEAWRCWHWRGIRSSGMNKEGRYVIWCCIFAARCSVQARPLPSCGVCLSVTFVHSVKTSTHILRLFSPSSRSIILVFSHETGRQYTNWNPPLTEASNTKGYKNHDFRLISRFISKLMQDRAIVTTEGK